MTKKNRRNRNIATAVLIAVALSVLVLFAVRAQRDQDLINFKPPTLNQEEVTRLNGEIEALEKELAEKEDQSKEEKFKLLMELGLQQRNLGELELARESFKKAADLFKNNVVVVQELFTTTVAMEDFSAAEKHGKVIAERSPGLPGFWEQYILLQKEHLEATNEKLLELYAVAVTQPTVSTEIQQQYAELLEAEGDIQKAREQWLQLADANLENRFYRENELRLSEILAQ